MSLAEDFLQEIMTLLTEEAENLTAEEQMQSLVDIIDDYKSEMTLDENDKEQRENMLLMGVSPDEDDESEENEADEDDEDIPKSKSTATKIGEITPVTRALLMDKAKKQYYKKHDLTDEAFDELAPSVQAKHRRGVSELLKKLLEQEANKPQVVSKYSSSPFKKTSVVRKNEEEEDDEEFDDDEITPAHKKWRKERIRELKSRIREVEAKIEQLEKQNSLAKVTATIRNRNADLIAELEDDRENLEEQLQQYM